MIHRMMKSGMSWLLMAVLVAVTIPTVGCTGAQVENEVNTILTEATNVLVVADPNAAWVPQLQAAITTLKTAEASWTGGGTVQVVIDALNTVEAITAVIPLTAAYSPLIDVLVAGIEAVLAALPAGTSGTSAAVRLSINPHVGRVKIAHRFLHSRTKEFVSTWNVAAQAHGLVGAAIQ